MKKKILVVDNSRLLLKLMTDILTKHGHEVLTAIDGLNALEVVESFQPDIMFIDLVMPKINGDKLCRVIRTMPSMDHVFIAILSAVALEQNIDFIGFGADACIAKGPFKEIEEHVLTIIGQAAEGREKGKSREIIGTEKIYHREVTRELLLSKKHFEITLHNISEGFVELTEAGRIILVNKAAAQLFEMPEEKMLSVLLVDLFQDDTRLRISSCLACLDNTAVSLGEESPLVVNGRELFLTFIPFQDEEERSIIVLLSDISDRKRNERELCRYRENLEKLVEERAKELVETNRKLTEEIAERQRAEEERRNLELKLQQAQKMEAIGTLAGGIAHDFNNILSAILGYAEISMLELGPNHPVNSRLNEVRNATSRARKLVRQILTFSRQSEQEFAPVQVVSIIKETLKLLRASIPATIEINQQIEENCQSAVVMADQTQIHQILMNLCTNAYHAMRQKGSGTLGVRLGLTMIEQGDTKVSEFDLVPGPFLNLAISDSGHGMDSDTLQRIFDPYYTTKERGQGTGLGLSVVHGIVKSHGGAITVSSEPGQGATFTVFLPQAQMDFYSDEIGLDSEMPGGDERILFVDDEEVIVATQKELLEALGYTVTGKTSSRDAMELFEENPDDFDLLITDMTMPKMTGAALAQRVLEIRPEMPVILCTGFSEAIDEKKAKAMGIAGYLLKPVVMKELAEKVREALDR